MELGHVDDPLERDADRVVDALLSAAPNRPEDEGNDATPLVRLPALRHFAGAGRPLPGAVQHYFEERLGVDLGQVRIHTDTAAAAAAQALSARAFALGSDLVFGRGEFGPHTLAGLRLLAHELAHVLQQTPRSTLGPATAALPDWVATSIGSRGTPLLQRRCVPRNAEAEELGAPPSTTGAVPDDAEVDRAIEWPLACDKNRDWWTQLELAEVHPIRDLDPELQPREWANRTLRAQQLLREHRIGAIEGARLDRDGIFGPRMLLALVRVAENERHPARALIQGLGFDLDAIRNAEGTILRARAYARRPETILQVPIEVLGESAVRYYDAFYSMVAGDRDVFDDVLFNGAAPEGIRREDRIELLRRLYGREEHRLQGTVAFVRAHRDFIHTRLDVARAVEHDRRERLDRSHFFAFVAVSPSVAASLAAFFDTSAALDRAKRRLSPTGQADYGEGIDLLLAQDPEPAQGAEEVAAILVAIYLPVVDELERTATVDSYLAEKAERERVERERIEEHNQGVAHQRADRLVALIDDEDMYRPLRMVRFRSELESNLGEQQFFDLVLDDLRARPNNEFNRLFNVVEAVDGGLGTLVQLALSGRYRDDPRVRRAQASLIDTHEEHRDHTYIVAADGGAVLLGGSDRLEIGQVAGEVSSIWLRDEDREQLKPESRRRLEQQLDSQSRAYMAGLFNGTETGGTKEEIGQLLLQRAWQAAGLDPDHDIEDVEWEESIRLLGVRRAPDRGDGVPRFDVQYEKVQRIVGGSGGDTPWVAIATSGGWRGESDFELDLWWYSYSQQADVMVAAIMVVTIGAVIVVAWEVGLIAALVAAGGGAIPVALSVGISLAIYMLTHERWTLEGLLLAGIEGYLAAVGFRVFAPVGQAVSRLVIPAALEQVAFRRVVAAWLLRHGTVGALTGGTVGPASLFVEDLIRIAGHGGGFSSFEAYLTRAGTGALLGAVFEIGGSALLAPLFRAADSSVLARVSDVVGALRGRTPPVSASQWLSEVAGSLSGFRTFLGNVADDAIANGIYNMVRERMRQVGAAWLTGVRGTIQREIIDLAGATISRDATNGLERLLRLGRGTLSDDALATLLQQARRTPERIDPWLRFIAGVDEATAGHFVARNQLRGLLDAEEVLFLAGRRSSPEMVTLMSTRFADSLDDLERFAARVNALDDTVADGVLDALRTRGTAVTPRSLLRICESGEALADDVLGGLRRMLDGADSARLDAVLDAMGDDQVAAFLRSAHTTPAPELDAMRRVVAAHDAPLVAWGVRLPITEAETLLTQLTANSRAVITDITAAEARDLIAALGIDRVNNALSLGTAGQLRGVHLRTLQQRLPLRAVDDILESAGVNPNSLARVARVSASLDASLARLPGSPVGAGTLVIDTNVRAAVDDLVRGFNKSGGPINVFADLDENYRTAVNAIRRARGLGDYVDLPGGARPTVDQVVGPGADLRATQVSGAETISGEALSGASRLLPQLRGVTPNRAHPDYSPVINDMATGARIGGGGLDRTIVADAMFAETTAGVIPTLVTVDRGIATRLARRYIVGPRTFALSGDRPAWTQLVERIPEGRFTIDILGHRLDVVFHPPTGLPPVP